LPEIPAHHISFNNVTISAKKGFSCVDAADIDLKKVKISTDNNEPLFSTNGCKNINIHD
jgi:hypothetical protein